MLVAPAVARHREVTDMDTIATVFGILCCGLPIVGIAFWLADILE